MILAHLQQAGLPAGEVRQRALEVLARPEFQPESPSALEELLASLLSWVSRSGAGETLSLILPYLAGALVFLFLLQVLRWRAPRRERAPGASLPSRQPLDPVRLEELLQRARAASQRGDRLLALRLYAFALLVGLSQRGDLEFREAWTNRELLERGRPSAEVLATLGPLVDELDAKCFGPRPVEAADVERFAGLCRRWLGGDGLRPA